MVHHALDGGGAVTLKLDAQGKTFAQALLRMPLLLADDVAESVLSHWGAGLPEDCIVSEAP
jgi:hypothetical protein